MKYKLRVIQIRLFVIIIPIMLIIITIYISDNSLFRFTLPVCSEHHSTTALSTTNKETHVVGKYKHSDEKVIFRNFLSLPHNILIFPIINLKNLTSNINENEFLN